MEDHVYVIQEDQRYAWKEGVVVETDEVGVKVRLTNVEKEEEMMILVLKQDVENRIVSRCCMDEKMIEDLQDLGELLHLNEPGMVDCLKRKFEKNQIYVFTGPVLLCINPFQRFKDLYDINHYHNTAEGGEENDLPHVYTTAKRTYKALNTTGINQTILVSGESGSGKTESAKFIMEYLANQSTGSSLIEKRVLQSNPILESFGNARTLRNDNSSRFGKFIKLYFENNSNHGRGEERVLTGVGIDTYLLEKVRLVHQSQGERNFHIFYELLKGASEKRRNALFLNDWKSYRYLNQSGCEYRCDGVEDKAEFIKTLDAMERMGFFEMEQNAVFEIVAGLLHLGNVNFVEKGGTIRIVLDTLEHLEHCARLFQLPMERLRETLLCRRVKMKQDAFTVVYTAEQASEARDAMARTIYQQLFSWIVQRINQAIVSSSNSSPSSFIGVLDIFGFEEFKTNGFEQLCINYANECLQHQFTEFVLANEQKEYKKENIPWSDIPYNDNIECCLLFEAKTGGLLSLLDQECIIPQGSDRGFALKVYQQCKEEFFVKHLKASSRQQAEQTFVVRHYSGSVCYTIDGFCDKNKDRVHADIETLLRSSGHGEMMSLVKEEEEEVEDGPHYRRRRRSSGTLANSGVGCQFKRQLTELLNLIKSTQPHYIRCLKPNDANVKSVFNESRIAEQLRCGGVFEVVRVSRAGFGVRLPLATFLERYSRSKQPILPLKQAVERLIHESKLKKIVVGKTKVFMKQSTYNVLENSRKERFETACVHIGSFILMVVYKRRFIKMKQSILLIQCCYRRYKRLQYVTSVCLIQCVYRKRLIRKKRESKAAVVIQAFVYGIYVEQGYRNIRNKIVSIQCWWRCRKAYHYRLQLERDERDLKGAIHERNALRKQLLDLQRSAERDRRRAELAEEELKQHRSSISSNEEERVVRRRPLSPVHLLEKLGLQSPNGRRSRLSSCSSPSSFPFATLIPSPSAAAAHSSSTIPTRTTHPPRVVVVSANTSQQKSPPSLKKKMKPLSNALKIQGALESINTDHPTIGIDKSRIEMKASLHAAAVDNQFTLAQVIVPIYLSY